LKVSFEKDVVLRKDVVWKYWTYSL